MSAVHIVTAFWLFYQALAQSPRVAQRSQPPLPPTSSPPAPPIPNPPPLTSPPHAPGQPTSAPLALTPWLSHDYCISTFHEWYLANGTVIKEDKVNQYDTAACIALCSLEAESTFLVFSYTSGYCLCMKDLGCGTPGQPSCDPLDPTEIYRRPDLADPKWTCPRNITIQQQLLSQHSAVELPWLDQSNCFQHWISTGTVVQEVIITQAPALDTCIEVCRSVPQSTWLVYRQGINVCTCVTDITCPYHNNCTAPHGSWLHGFFTPTYSWPAIMCPRDTGVKWIMDQQQSGPPWALEPSRNCYTDWVPSGSFVTEVPAEIPTPSIADCLDACRIFSEISWTIYYRDTGYCVCMADIGCTRTGECIPAPNRTYDTPQTLYPATSCPRDKVARALMQRQRVSYPWLDPGSCLPTWVSNGSMVMDRSVQPGNVSDCISVCSYASESDWLVYDEASGYCLCMRDVGCTQQQQCTALSGDMAPYVTPEVRPGVMSCARSDEVLGLIGEQRRQVLGPPLPSVPPSAHLPKRPAPTSPPLPEAAPPSLPSPAPPEDTMPPGGSSEAATSPPSHISIIVPAVVVPSVALLALAGLGLWWGLGRSSTQQQPQPQQPQPQQPQQQMEKQAAGARVPFDRTAFSDPHAPEPGRDVEAFITAAMASHTSIDSRGLWDSNRSQSVPQRMMREVQQLISSLNGTPPQDKLVIQHIIGQGGYGTVYKGTWRNLDVAVKTVRLQEPMPLPALESDPIAALDAAAASGAATATAAASGAGGPTLAPPSGAANWRAARGMAAMEEAKRQALLEAAVCSAVVHRNVVTTYHYDIVESSKEGLGRFGISIHDVSRQMVEFSLILVQEFCQSTLADLLRGGYLHHNKRPIMRAIVLLLQDIANGMAYIHSCNIIHADLKPENVLLRVIPEGNGASAAAAALASSGPKRAASAGAGPETAPAAGVLNVVAKVADFGLCALLDVRRTHVSGIHKGTPFYTAPEVAEYGKATPASDVYAYGIIMWSLYTSALPWVRRPNGGTMKNPVFKKWPHNAPQPYRSLACRCMSLNPEERPSFVQVLQELQAMQEQWSRQQQHPPGGAAPAAAMAVETDVALAVASGGGGGASAAAPPALSPQPCPAELPASAPSPLPQPPQTAAPPGDCGPISLATPPSLHQSRTAASHSVSHDGADGHNGTGGAEAPLELARDSVDWDSMLGDPLMQAGCDVPNLPPGLLSCSDGRLVLLSLPETGTGATKASRSAGAVQ